MTSADLYELFKIEDLKDLPNAIYGVLFGDTEHRDKIYFRLLELNKHDMGHDWFQNIYEEELAQRKQSKQDFTPNSLSILVSRLTGQKGKIYEPTAGNGSMLIADWHQRCLNAPFPIMHFPADNMFECWELSSRAIPILLLNLSIRGMMGIVYHGDVLTMEIKAKYILLNRHNDTLAFSEIIKDKNLNLKIIEK